MVLAGRSIFVAGFFAFTTLALSSAGWCQGQGEAGAAREVMTPLLLAVQDAPVPFAASDGRTHMAYELWMTNFSSGDAELEKVEVLGDGALLKILDTTAVAAALQPAGMRTDGKGTAGGTLVHSSTALLFLDVALAPGAMIPKTLSHRISARFAAAPKGQQEISETGGDVKVDRQAVVVISPPLQGAGYISADSCCDSTRHVRAALAANGRVWVAQRGNLYYVPTNVSLREAWYNRTMTIRREAVHMLGHLPPYYTPWYKYPVCYPDEPGLVLP